TADRRILLVAGGLPVLIMVRVPALFGGVSGLGAENLAVVSACGLALAAGCATRNRRAYVAEVEERVRRAEHSREQEARRRVTEERLRIARDLHDSLGHHIALINAQAGLGTHVFDKQPAAARQALAHIMQESREALDDLRKTIGLLRHPGEPVAPNEHTPGLIGVAPPLAPFRHARLPAVHPARRTRRPL